MVRLLVILRNLLVYWWYCFQALTSNSKIPHNPVANFIVSIASYPKRDHLLPVVFQALMKQTILPCKWVLVLSLEDYTNGLPHHLRKLKERGLEILLVKNNPYAVKKLLPVIEKYPEIGIVTLDDDIIYHKSLLSGLIQQLNSNDNSIVGYVGKAIVKRDGKLSMNYRETLPATLNTPAEQVYLIGWAGIYYPPFSLHSKALNLEAVHQIVPGRGSDIWFWAAAHAKGTKQVCLGLPRKINLGIPIPQNKMTKPKDRPSFDELEQRFQSAIDYFEIRQQLLHRLPEAK